MRDVAAGKAKCSGEQRSLGVSRRFGHFATATPPQETIVSSISGRSRNPVPEVLRIGEDVVVTTLRPQERRLLSGPAAILARPLIWAISYVLLVPTFGTAYSFMHGQFTQTTALREASPLSADATRVLAALKQASVRDRLSGPVVKLDDGWITDLRKCTWSALAPATTDPSEVAAYVRCVATKPANKLVEADFDFNADFSPVVERTSDPYWIRTVHLESAPNSAQQETLHLPDPTAAELFFSLGSYTVGDANLLTDGSLLLNAHEEQLLGDFEKAINGDPTEFRHSIVRMTYFSAVTVTTLGYGDIVPIADAARTLVALEAVLGVVLAGLFLNALGQKYLTTRNGLLPS